MKLHSAQRAALVVAIAILTGGLGGRPARAEDKGAAREEDKAAAREAREHYQRATSYYDLARYADAIKEFEAAYQIKNDPALLYNLAQSYRLAGNPEQALHFYKTYLRYVPRPPNKAEIDERISSLEALVALQTRPPNQTIAPGSAGPSTGPATGAATAGGATADGSSKAVAPPPAAPTPPTPPSFANSSASSAASASPPPSSAAAPTWPPSSSAAAPNGGPPSVSLAAPPPATDRGHTFQVAGLITGGAGVVMIVVGIIEGVRARNAASDVEAEARNGVPFDPSVESRGQTAETAQWWLLGLGALAGAGGAGLWLYGRHVSATAERSPDAGANRVSFVPVVSPERAGAWLRVRF